MGTCQGVLCCSQDEVNSDSEESRCCNKCFVKCWVKVEPIDFEKYKILIPHNNIDKDRRDPFGANLVTFTEKRKDGSTCYIHRLEDVSTEGPAGQMDIRNKDELIFVNENFAQDMKPKEVLDHIGKEKVDGKTPLKLVVWRAKEWIRSEAVFEQSRSVDQPPSVQHLKLHISREDYYEQTLSQHRYQGRVSGKYLKISDGSFSFDTLECGEKTTIVLKKERVYMDKRKPELKIYEAALSDVFETSYIGIDIRRQMAVLKKQPVWFKFDAKDSIHHFNINGMCLGEGSGTLKVFPRHDKNSECGLDQDPTDCNLKNENPGNYVSTRIS